MAWLLIAAVIAAAPSDTERSFQDWVARRANDSGLTVVTWDTRDLEGDGRPDRVAVLCDATDKSRAWFVIEKDGEQRWIIEQAGSDGWASSCSADYLPKPEWSHSEETTLVLRTERPDWASEVHVAVRGGIPVVVFRKTVASGDSAPDIGLKPRSARPDRSELSLNADRLVITERLNHGRDALVANEAAIVPVLAASSAERQTLPTTVNKIVSGREEWNGSDDTAISVSATRVGSDIVVHLQAHDDELRPAVTAPRSEPEEARVDHRLLTWCRGPSSTCQRVYPIESTELHRVLFGSLKGGAVWSRASHGRDVSEPSPSISADGRGGFDLKLSADSLGCTGACEVPLTACYSDADEKKSTPTKVCSSDWKPGVPRTFGLLLERADLSRFEPIGRKIFPESKLRR